MSRFTVTDTPLVGLKVVTRQKLGDSRGHLTRLFCAQELSVAGWHGPVAQINQTLTGKRATLRGMHYQQPPHAEAKLVICTKGEVWDVAVDIRAGSPTFLHWHAEVLSATNCRALLIPEGFAHGFQTLTDDCEMLYLHSSAYAPQTEAALNAFDDRLAIPWPLPATELSARDAAHPMLTAQFTGLKI